MKIFYDLYWDEQNIEHIARHRVTPDEVEQAVFSSMSRIRKGRGQNIYYVLGRTDSGRYLFVVLKNWRSGIGYVITTRDMTDKERRWYLE